MYKTTNINWNAETELVNINECKDEARNDSSYTEEDFRITFEHNGINIFATIDYTLDLKITEEEEIGNCDIEVISTDVTIKEMYDSEDELIKMSAKQEIEIENQLQIELAIEY